MKNQKDIYIGNHIAINSEPNEDLYLIDKGKGRVYGQYFTLGKQNWKVCYRKVDVVNGVTISELVVYYWKEKKEKEK